MKARLRGERGSNAVEFALVLPLLIVILFGILWGGIAYDRQQTVAQAAREGARFGATVPGAPSDDYLDEVEAVVLATVGRHINTATTPNDEYYICIAHVAEDGTRTARQLGTPQAGTPMGCTITGPAPDGARVEVIIERPASIELVFYRFRPRLRGEAVARYEGTP